MGIFDIFKKKKEPEQPPQAVPESTEIHIDEVHDWVNQTLSGKIKDKHERANELYAAVMKGFTGIKESADLLETARFDNPDKLGAVVNMTKDLFVKRVHNLVSGAQEFNGKPVDFNILKQFQLASEEALSDMSSITPKQAYLLSTYFNKESSGVIERIKETQENVSILKEFLDAEGETIQLAHSIKSRKDQQSLLKMRLNTVEKEESGIDMRIRELRNKTEKNLAEIDSIVKGHEYAEYNKITEQMENARKRSSLLKEKMVAEVSSVQRPLKKLEYLVSKNYPMLKEQEVVLDNMVNRPFEAVMKNTEQEIREILLLARKAFLEERVSLKDNERQRIDDLVSRLETDMRGMKADYEETEESIKDMEREKARYEWAIERKTHLENNIRRSLEEIGSLESVLNTSARDKDTIRKEMERQKHELEDILFKTSGKKVSIVVPEENVEGRRSKNEGVADAFQPQSPSGQKPEEAMPEVPKAPEEPKPEAGGNVSKDTLKPAEQKATA
jgi:hypothetical protein